MSTKALAETIQQLQRRVADIEAKIAVKPRASWKKVAGAASKDQHFAEAMKLGSRWRKQANREDW